MTDLGDQVRATTPKIVVRWQLEAIGLDVMCWKRIIKQLSPYSIAGVDSSPGNAAFEAIRSINAAISNWDARDWAIKEPHGEAFALASGRSAGGYEAEARCRIAEWVAG
jgi:hypothetical protein